MPYITYNNEYGHLKASHNHYLPLFLYHQSQMFSHLLMKLHNSETDIASLNSEIALLMKNFYQASGRFICFN